MYKDIQGLAKNNELLRKQTSKHDENMDRLKLNTYEVFYKTNKELEGQRSMLVKTMMKQDMLAKKNNDPGAVAALKAAEMQVKAIE